MCMPASNLLIFISAPMLTGQSIDTACMGHAAMLTGQSIDTACMGQAAAARYLGFWVG